MAPAHEGKLSWGTLFCFGRGQEALAAAQGTTAKSPWERSSSRRRREKRTVPVDVDGDLVVAETAADSEAMRRGTGTGEEESPSRNRKRKGLLLGACCFFLAPAERASGRKRKARTTRLTSGSNDSPPEAAQIRRAARGSTSNGNGGGGRSRAHGAEQPQGAAAEPCGCGCGSASSSKAARADGVGAGAGASFGPVVGLSVVVAVSMAGLLGGRLWAVACVCAWLAALSRLRRRRPARWRVAVDVDSSTDDKEPVVLRALLERDRRKAAGVAA